MEGPWGSRASHPKSASSVTGGLLSTRGNFSFRVQRNFCPSLLLLEDLELGTLPILRGS